jgi:hypothetical protein
VSELVLEDRQEGKEHTAAGMRHVSRQSFVDGLKGLMQQTNSPEHHKEVAELFSLKYILEKTGQWCGSVQESINSALDALLKPQSSAPNERNRLLEPIALCPNEPEVTQLQSPLCLALNESGPQAISVTEGVLIANNQKDIPPRTPAAENITAESLDKGIQEVLTELQELPSKQTVASTRSVDVDYAHGLGLLTNAPADVLAIAAHGIPGHVLKGREGLMGIIPPSSKDEMPILPLTEAILTRRRQNPKDPPLTILVACQGGAADGESDAAASQMARNTKTWVLGSLSRVDRTTTYAFDESCLYPNPKGKGYVLFDPLGRRVSYDFNNPMTVEDWNAAKKFAGLSLKE